MLLVSGHYLERLWQRKITIRHPAPKCAVHSEHCIYGLQILTHQLLHTSNAYNIQQLRTKSDGSSPSILPQAKVSPESACFPTFSSRLPYFEFTRILAISNKCFGLVDKYQMGFAANTTENKYWEVWSAVFPQHHISGLRSVDW